MIFRNIFGKPANGNLPASWRDGAPAPNGPLRASFPAKVHDFYFPQLVLDLPVEPPAQRAA